MDRPIFFERNRVFRVYTGGKLFADFFGDEAKDGFFPEEWIASAVRAINKNPTSEKEGVSRLRGTDTYFDELLAADPEGMLGSKRKMRILVKILDSAVRLPAQAHPDKPFSRKHFNSEYGKTESWLILGTRPEAKIYFGFKDGVDRARFEAAIDESLTNKAAFEDILEYSYAKEGDVYLVPARTVHAIGAGCLILEVQEPTDFTIQPEHYCDDYKLSDREMYIGLSRADAVDCFDFGKAPQAMRTPTEVEKRDGVLVESLISPRDTDCFEVRRITLSKGEYTPSLADSYGVYIVTDGEGEILGEGYSFSLKRGEYFFLPACAMGKCRIIGNLSIVECY